MIPSIHPHIIRDEDDFKSKVCIRTCTEFLRGLHLSLCVSLWKAAWVRERIDLYLYLSLYIAYGLVGERLTLFK